MRKKYRLVDCLGLQVVGHYNTIKEANKAGNKFFIDNDGHCDLSIELFNHEINRYEYYSKVTISSRTEIAVFGE